jgi:putative addiction module component (TIGR02574 family)
MNVDIEQLLALPQKERRAIAEKLWSSLAPSATITKEEKEIISLLEARWANYKNGKSTAFTPEELRKKLDDLKTNL